MDRKTRCALLVETAEKFPQKTATGLPKGSLCGEERKSLQDLEFKAEITVLISNKGNVTMILNTWTGVLRLPPRWRIIPTRSTTRFSLKSHLAEWL